MKSLLLIALLLFTAEFSIAQIPFRVLPSGHIVVKAKVDGTEGSFILDTGAGLTVFTKKFFDRLPHTSPVDGGFTGFRATGERLDITLYKAINFEFGTLRKAEDEVGFFDIDLAGMDGILSLKLFEQQPFTIDYTTSTIILETDKSVAGIRKAASRVPLQLEHSRGKALDIFAYFRVNDALTLQFSLDSGAGKDVYKLNANTMKRLGAVATDTISRKSEMNTGFVTHIYKAKVNSIAAADAPAVKVEQITAQFTEGLIYDGIMWFSWMGDRITVDIPGKQLLVAGKK